MGLTDQQKRFVVERRAHPEEPVGWSAARAGASTKRATKTGREWLANPKVREAIANGFERKLEAAKFTKDAILADIAILRDACIQDGGSTALKTRLEADIALAKMGGFFQERVEVGIDIKLLERIDNARRRVGKEPAFNKPELTE